MRTPPHRPGGPETGGARVNAPPAHNAICLGGPCHGMLTHIDQDIGVLAVPVPRRSPDDPEAVASYRVTRERVHHPSCSDPFIALHWADQAAQVCPCGCERSLPR
ncbi:hypothetical protein Psi02_74780 [Planotetraspora silvatica]|uniref:Uncharacterized protein n=1 Tax=Planotetraspora silvatica TaxID=234614 RepID=A0A8J3USD4_9ACTN|nr:hypothetical protein Psi02_74780 [Planotetraspora silvatica]